VFAALRTKYPGAGKAQLRNTLRNGWRLRELEQNLDDPME
jgi:hypothetical protein